MNARKQIIKQGPCMICGGPYAAHRLIEAQMGRIAAGDEVTAIALEYEQTVPEMIEKWLALVQLLLDKAE